MENVIKFDINSFKIKYKEVPFEDKILADTSYKQNILNEFDNIFSSEKRRINIFSPPNSGKTTAIINYCIANNISFILLEPYTSIVDQLLSENISLRDKEAFKIFKSELNLHFVLTYEGLSTNINYVKDKLENNQFYLIVDEYHNFISHLNFRKDSITTIIKNYDLFKKVIFLTGTPEGIYIEENAVSNIEFKNVEPSSKRNLEIIQYKCATNLYLDNLLKDRIDKKGVILWNHKNDLGKFKKLIISKYPKIKDKIKLISSKNKDSEDYLAIAENQSISSKTNLLLTTCVISDGVNIKDNDIDYIILVNVKDLVLLRQFIKRFRNFNGEIIDIINKKSTINNALSNVDYQKLYDQLKLIYKIFIEFANTIETTRIDLLEEIKLLLPILISDMKGMSCINSKLSLLKEELLLFLLDHHYKIAYNDIAYRKEFLEKYENLKCQTKKDDYLQSNTIKNKAKHEIISDYLKILSSIDKYDLLDLLDNKIETSQKEKIFNEKGYQKNFLNDLENKEFKYYSKVFIFLSFCKIPSQTQKTIMDLQLTKQINFLNKLSVIYMKYRISEGECYYLENDIEFLEFEKGNIKTTYRNLSDDFITAKSISDLINDRKSKKGYVKLSEIKKIVNNDILNIYFIKENKSNGNYKIEEVTSVVQVFNEYNIKIPQKVKQRFPSEIKLQDLLPKIEKYSK